MVTFVPPSFLFVSFVTIGPANSRLAAKGYSVRFRALVCGALRALEEVADTGLCYYHFHAKLPQHYRVWLLSRRTLHFQSQHYNL